MAAVTKDRILEELRRVKGPNLEGDIVSLGLVSEIVINGGKVIFSISVDPERAFELEPLREAAEQVVADIPGVEQVMVALTADRAQAQGKAAPAPQQAAPSGGSHGAQADLPNVKSIIAVASGKGGVGKSTSAINIALGLKALGLKVGVLDADIYGPSMPRLLGITDQPQAANESQLAPMKGFGLEVMSIGFLVEEDTPMIWRGPMVMSAITQMLREVDWGELDVLVVDMPPGTGDAQLTMAQQVPLAGAVIISTPQDLALIDARKGIAMFRKVDVPILGVVENMSYFLCPSCGTRSNIFGTGGAKAEATRLGVPFLGEVPLHMDIREKSDAGTPVVAAEPDGPHAKIYKDIAARVWADLQAKRGGAKAAPKIVVEN
ncbi:MAG TPA: iron-sulfur cluster carrier protein ApbC [Hyphomicrobiales bacterium]|nr:iron-sulfur cluster carrier protein ApbC [Hyphomicrobiales bacterium]